MTHEKVTPTFCIHVQHSWIYSVTRAACGTLGFDDCIISWHYLIQSRYMHNEAWTKQHPNLLSVFTGVCMKDSGCYFSVLCVFFAVFPLFRILHRLHFPVLSMSPLEMHRLQFSWPIPIFFCKCDLPIPFFADSDFLSKNYNWQHIQTKIYTF